MASRGAAGGEAVSCIFQLDADPMWGGRIIVIHQGDCLDFIATQSGPFDLIVTDPPYAFGGSGQEHAIVATVAIALRECARKLADGSWMLIFCASSWRSTAYMAESVRGILDPVRIGTWCKPRARTKARTPGWQWASVNVLACRKGKGRGEPGNWLDHILAEPITRGRRAELPEVVADWAVAPFAVSGGLFLDPFAGSGVLVRAARKAGMEAIGCEKETGGRSQEMLLFQGGLP